MTTFKYDLAISFAGEQRSIAEDLARRLDAAGYAVFYDRFEEAELWGRDLTTTLGQVYSRDAKYCLVLLSNEYVAKAWTNLERQNALSRFIRDRGGYVLCVKLDPVELPGLPDVVAYVNFEGHGEDGIFRLLLAKLGTPDHSTQVSELTDHDRDRAREIVEACFRRAIFTRMDSEIMLDAMYESIGHAIGNVQRITPQITSPSLQRAGLEIIASLDIVERTRRSTNAGVSNHVAPAIKAEIDSQKRNVVRLLLEIRRAARLPIQMPYDLQVEHFFSVAEGDARPRA
jgi:hypothetical protein